MKKLTSVLSFLLLIGSPFGLISADASDTPPPSSVTVAGSLQSELGCPGDWDPSCATTHLSFDAGDNVWQGMFSIPAGSWEYKAALNNSWDENYGINAQRDGANIPLNLSTNTGVKFYYDHETHWITDNVNSIIATAPGNYQSEIGCPGDWQPDCLRSWLQDPDGDGIYTFHTNAIPPGDYEVKVAINESWDENYGAGGVPGGANILFTVSALCGDTIFSYDPATHILSVSSLEAPYVWSIDKSADQTNLTLSPGQQFLVAYQIAADVSSAGCGIDECIEVSDTYAGYLGMLCETGAQFTYERIIGPFDACGEYTVDNTASFVTNDTGTTGGDSWIVNVSVPCSGCTLTPGYWKTHSEFGPAPYDEKWAYLSNGANTTFFSSGQTYYEVLWTAPSIGNAYYILAHQYITAELNILNGASASAAQAAFASATSLFNTYTPAQVAATKGKNGQALRHQFISLAEVLDGYNNGYTGPGHCSE